MLPHETQRGLELLGHVGVQLNAGLLAPEDIGCDGQIAEAGPIPGFLHDARIHAENFLDKDNRAARRTFRVEDKGGNLAIGIEGGDKGVGRHLSSP